ncbi:MAG: hypothetical protein IKN17_03135 [Ruminococcus sp.]|nr:hypothetical protein [Ruminococcus sp.]
MDNENVLEPVRELADGSPQNEEIPPFTFLGTGYTGTAELVSALERNWQEGKAQLFSGALTDWYHSWDPDTARKCRAAQEEGARESGSEDVIYRKLLCQLDPQRRSFAWRGLVFESLPALGKELLGRLWDRDGSLSAYCLSIPENRLLSHFAAFTGDEALARSAALVEGSYELERDNGTDLQMTLYLMAYTLSGQKILLLDGERFSSVTELADYMRGMVAESYERFRGLCRRLADDGDGLDPQLEAWFIALGRQDELDRWRQSLNG